MFSFEQPDAGGISLITGEMVLLESEVPKTVKKLMDAGVIVSAIHSHWLYDNPKLIYIHLETNMNPVNFAKIVAPIVGNMH